MFLPQIDLYMMPLEIVILHIVQNRKAQEVGQQKKNLEAAPTEKLYMKETNYSVTHT